MSSKPKRNILIVEDEYILALVMVNKMKESGLGQVHHVTTASEVLQKVKESSIHLILMDIILSDDVDGIAAARQIRELSEVPIIFVTANANESIKNDIAAISNSHLVNKPVDYQELKKLARRII